MAYFKRLVLRCTVHSRCELIKFNFKWLKSAENASNYNLFGTVWGINFKFQINVHLSCLCSSKTVSKKIEMQKGSGTK